MRVVLFGAPGAGKGTQGPLLARRLGVPYIAVGDLLRAEASAAPGSAGPGSGLAATMARGALVADHLVNGVVERALRPALDGFVLDGFPRTVTQARALDRFLGAHAASVDAALWFRVPRDRLVERLASRGRADDTPDVIGLRLALHERGEASVLEHYLGRIVELDAVGPAEQVHARALDGLREAALAQ